MTLLNSLTPVAFAGTYQLLFGNLVLGIIESYLIANVFDQKPRYFIIILANYVSAIFGYGIASLILDPTSLNMVQNYREGPIFLSLLVYTTVAYCVTLVVEFPFYYWGIRNHDGSRIAIRLLVKEIAIVHIVSYFLTLFIWTIFVVFM